MFKKEVVFLICRILLILLIAIFLDYFFATHNKRFNLTGNLKYELSQRTKKILRSLKGDVNIIYFGSREKPKTDLIRKMLTLYSNYSHKIKWRVIDPVRNPDLVKRYGLPFKGEGAIVNYKGKSEKIIISSEADLTNAILRLSTKKLIIYFLLRDGEYNPFDPNGICTKVIDMLKAENYEVRPLYWNKKIYIPKDAALLIDWKPKKEFSNEEINCLEDFLRKGGRLLFMIEPFSVLSLNKLLNKFCVVIKNDIVVDSFSRLIGGDMFMPVVTPNMFGHSLIMRSIGLPVILPMARPIYLLNSAKNSNLCINVILKSNPKSWTISRERYKKWDFGYNGKGHKGPIPLGVSLKEKDNNAKMIVIGDADFANNSYINFPGMDNRALFLNLVEWLCRGEAFLGRRPEIRKYNYRFLEEHRIKRLFYWIMFMPALVLVIGIVVYFKTKKARI